MALATIRTAINDTIMATFFDTLIRETDKVISIVGAGGKTSLMFLLAHDFQQKGFRVISTTTTRILKPTAQQTSGVVLFNHDNFHRKLEDCLNRYGHATVAQHLLASGDKLQGLSCTDLEQVFAQSSAERMIIEADGARKLSFKAPSDNEPVMPKTTDLFISVVGLDIIGKPLEETNVFRAELVSSRTGLQTGDEITPLTVAKLAVHPKGLLKGCPKKAGSYIFLNKTDIPGGRDKALAVIEAAQNLEGIKPNFWVSGSLRKQCCYQINTN